MHRLSCKRCKERKVRCNRVVPRCNHCTSHNADCIYPERVKRQPQPRSAERSAASAAADAASSTSTDDAALGGILHRLQRLEHENQRQYSSSNNPATAPIHSNISSPPVITPVHSDGTTSLSTPGRSSRLDVTATLAEAIGQVKQQKQKQNARLIITGRAFVPPEIAKTWMKYYLDTMATDIFPNLINEKLMMIIPDIIHEPHIQVDISLQVLYYVICYHGYMLAPSTTRQEREYANSCYVGCMRAIPQWKREAKGSSTDFVASLLLTRIATAMFDYEVAWDMHKLTNDFARARNLQNLDGGIQTDNEDCDESDNQRRGFWYLIQVDLYIRLLMDKPPTITADKWQVNLPWLESNSQGQQPEGITAIGFLISSRITMVLMRFFTLLDNPSRMSKAKLTSDTEHLCHEIEQIFTDWKAFELFAETSRDSDDLWVLVDCLITGYTSIIFMLRKVEVVFTGEPHTMTNDSHLPQHPVALNAARHVVRVSKVLLDAYPNPEMVSAIFGAHQVYSGVSRVYLEAIYERGSQTQTHREDLELIESFSQQVLSICSGYEDLYPFMKAINTLNDCVKDRSI